VNDFPPLSVVEMETALEIVAGENHFTFNLETGQLDQVLIDGKDILVAAPVHNVWRAPTDNDEGGDESSFAQRWLAAGYDNLNRTLVGIDVDRLSEQAIRLITREKFSGAQGAIDVRLAYTVLGNGDLHVDVQTAVDPLLPVLPKIGMTFSLPERFRNLKWYGRGPHESYWDRKHGAHLGIYSGLVEEQYHDYVRPQENGNKADVRWATLTNDEHQGVLIYGLPDFNLSTHHYSMENLTDATHTYQIKNAGAVTVNVDNLVMGLGGDDSWNPRTHKEFLIPPNSYNYSFILRFSKDLDQAQKQPFGRILSSPSINTAAASFIDQATVSLEAVIPGADIVLDSQGAGSKISSVREPFRISESITLTAHSEKAGWLSSVASDFEVVKISEPFTSETLRFGNPAQTVSIPLEGVRTLILLTDATADGTHEDHTDWCDAHLIDADGQKIYLSDLKPHSSAQGWGKLGFDRSVGDRPLKIANQDFEKGLGTHSNSRLVFSLNGEYQTFSARIGIDDNAGSHGSAIFKVQTIK